MFGALKLLVGSNPTGWLVVGLVLLSAFTGLAGWGFYERSAHMSALVDVQKEKTEVQKQIDQVAVLAGKLKEQSVAVDGWKATAEAAQAESMRLKAAADAKDAARQVEIDRLKALAAAAGKAGGIGDDCRKAWAQIRGKS